MWGSHWVVVSGRHCQADQTHCTTQWYQAVALGPGRDQLVEAVLVATALQQIYPPPSMLLWDIPISREGIGLGVGLSLLGNVFVPPRQIQSVCVRRDSFFL